VPEIRIEIKNLLAGIDDVTRKEETNESGRAKGMAEPGIFPHLTLWKSLSSRA
jgi:hypothetical protein